MFFESFPSFCHDCLLHGLFGFLCFVKSQTRYTLTLKPNTTYNHIQSSEHITSLGCFSEVRPIENCAPPFLPVFLISNYVQYQRKYKQLMHITHNDKHMQQPVTQKKHTFGS